MKPLIRAFISCCCVLPLSAGQYEEKPLVSFEDGAIAGWSGENGATVEAAVEHATAGGSALKARFTSTDSRVIARGDFNLSGWDKIKIDVFNTGDPLIATFTFRDGQGQEYKVWYQYAGRGENTIECAIRGMVSQVPEKGTVTVLDVAHIVSIAVALEGPKFPDLYLDNLRLTRGQEATITPAAPPAKELEMVAGNILDNGDFELGLLQWNTWGQWDGGLYRFGCVGGDAARTGAYACEIACDKQGRGGIFTRLPVHQAGQYIVRFWARGVGKAELQMSLDPVLNTKFGPAPETWTKYEVPAKLDADCSLYLYNIGAGNLYLDSVSVVRTGPHDVPEPVQPAPPMARNIAVRGDRTFVDGQPFFPIGMYSLRDPMELANSDFNFVVNEDFSDVGTAFFEKCAMAGMLTYVNLSGLLRAHVPYGATEVANRLKGMPSVFGYYLCDEPDHALWPVPPSELRQAAKLLRDADPGHPTIALTMAWDRSVHYQFGDVSDILSSDPYCGDEDIDYPIRAVKRSIDAGAATRPVWVVLEAGEPGDVQLPSANGLIAQCYAAIASGADGIFWHQYSYLKAHPEALDRVKALAGELKALGEELCGDEPADAQPKFSDPRVIGITKKGPRSTLVIAVNASMDDIGAVTVTCPGIGDNVAETVFETRPAAFSNDAMTEFFGPGQRRVYRFKYP